MKRILVILAVVVVVLVVFVAIGWAQVGPVLNPAFEQPMVFPHQIHVRVASVDCTFCHRHTTDPSSRTAGYPAVQQCMFCHNVVATDRPAIQQIQTAWANKEPITWVRVYRMPDHVHFIHAPHIRAGFECTTCHGNVADMQLAEQVRVLRMGVCMDCHRANNARTDCSVCHY